MPNSQPRPQHKNRLPASQTPELRYAISIKQPWAALIVHGIKTVEVRSWSTARRGPLLIHASKTLEADPAAWNWVTTPEVEATAAITGGVIGDVQLVDCIEYTTQDAFIVDMPRHKAGVHWWKPVRYGFVLAKPRPLVFVPWPGNTNFFGVTAVFTAVRKPRRACRRAPAAGPVIVRLPESPVVRPRR